MAKEVTDAELKDVATVSAGGNEKIGQLISDAMARVVRGAGDAAMRGGQAHRRCHCCVCLPAHVEPCCDGWFVAFATDLPTFLLVCPCDRCRAARAW